MTDVPVLRMREIRLLERPVRLRLPFRYGVVTLREAPQAFVRVRVECGGESAWGSAAELLAPKWFDKDPRLTDAQNMDQLRLSVALAADGYRDTPAASAFGHAQAAREAMAARARDARLPGLVAGFGPALLERAVLDALCRLRGASVFQAVAANLPGIRFHELAPDLGGIDTDAVLARLAPPRALDARHTVGMLDPLTDAEVDAEAPRDGLPVSLDQVIARYGNRWFKLKIGGDLDADLDRLARVAGVLQRACPGGWRVTLDGNEMYRCRDELSALLAGLRGDAHLEALCRAVAFLEQPLHRDVALGVDLADLDCPFPLIIDESDGFPDAFPRARDRGYAGVSSKQCKGLYKSLANATRCAVWNERAGTARHFMSGEDLTCQGGLSVQQDLALVALLGVTHTERNGHHFGGPMPGAPPREHRAFLDAHPDLYQDVGGRAALRIHHGRIRLDSLHGPGFAHGAEADYETMSPLHDPRERAGA